MDMVFRGTAPALVTPFKSDGAVDEAALQVLLDRQIAVGADAVVILGTTGENATVWPGERERLVEQAIAHVRVRIPVIVGTGNNSTAESIVFSKQAAGAGADGLLIVAPYYNKPTQAGFEAHVAAIADASDCPIILYNVPGRTGLNVTAETTLALANAVPQVVGIKEASGDLGQITDILAHRPEGLAVYAGDDEMAFPLASLGADGVISVLSNVLPDAMGRLVAAALEGRYAEAREHHYRLMPAMRACFLETNPIPVKAMLAHMGLIGPDLRLPLVPMTEPGRARMLDACGDLIAAER